MANPAQMSVLEVPSDLCRGVRGVTRTYRKKKEKSINISIRKIDVITFYILLANGWLPTIKLLQNLFQTSEVINLIGTILYLYRWSIKGINYNCHIEITL